MKVNGRWTKIATIALCLGLCTNGCQRSNDVGEGSLTDNVPVASSQHETHDTIAQIKDTPTPEPVERKDVRITGLMIGTGIDAINNITNPTSNYHVGNSIFALVRTSGNGPEATIKLRCKDQAKNVVFEESKQITPKGENEMVFELTASKNFGVGEYHLVGLLDDYPEMAVSIEVSN